MKNLKPIFNSLILLVAICVASVDAMAQTEVTITVNAKAYIVPQTNSIAPVTNVTGNVYTVCQSASVPLETSFIKNVLSSRGGDATNGTDVGEYSLTFSTQSDMSDPITTYTFPQGSSSNVTIYAKTQMWHTVGTGSCDTTYEFVLKPAATQTPVIDGLALGCGVKTTAYSASHPNQNSTMPNYIWSLVNTSGTLTPATGADATVVEWNDVAANTKDTVVFNYTDINGCIWYDSLAVEVNPTAIVTTDIASGTVCDSVQTAYTVVTNKVPTIFEWNILNKTNISNTAVDDSPAATAAGASVTWISTATGVPAAQGTATLQYISLLTTNGQTCRDTSEAIITVNAKPIAKLLVKANNGSTGEACNATSIVLTAELTTGRLTGGSVQEGWLFNWESDVAAGQSGTQTLTTTNPVDITVPIPNTTATTVKYGLTYIKDSNGCEATIPAPVIP